MEWNRSNAIGLALASCTFCDGHGTVEMVRGGALKPCDCVFRAIFRACYRRFRECATRGTQVGTVSHEGNQGTLGRHFYSRKREEYIADLYLVTRRVLTDFEFKLFRYTFLLGADSQLCSTRLGLEPGHYFHLLYRIEEKLGKAYADLTPYPLYPVNEYFGGAVEGRKRSMSHRKIRLRTDVDERTPMVRRPAGSQEGRKQPIRLMA